MINQRQIKGLKFDTLVAIKAAKGFDGELSFCVETNTQYKYIVAGSAYTADDKYILITGDGGNTRWLGISGQYIYNTLPKLSKIIPVADGLTALLITKADGTTCVINIGTLNSGVIGIGSQSPTPDWNDNVTALHLGSHTSFMGNNLTGADNYGANWIHNAYYVDALIWKYLNSAAATRYLMYAGTHYFSTAPAGTAGNTCTFTDRIRITSSGLQVFDGCVIYPISDSTTAIKFAQSNGTTIITNVDTTNKRWFFGGSTAPTALIHLAAGTTAAGTAPQKFTSGSLLATPEAGAMEFLSDKFYLTQTTGPTRKEIQLYDTYYGEAYFYTPTGSPSTSMAIDTTLLYHAVVLSTTAGSNAGFTHKVGQANNILSVSENVAGVSYKVTTSGNHNLVAGEPITHTGFSTRTEYRGKFIVQSTPSNTEYIVLGTYGGTDTGFMKRAFTLRANTGSAGVYRVGYNFTAYPASGTTNFKVEVNKNISDCDNIAAEALFITNTRNQCMSSEGLLTISDGDYVWLSIANLTDATDLSIRHCNLHLHRV